MDKVDAYSMLQQHALIREAKSRMETRHSLWRAFEVMYRYGSFERALSSVNQIDNESAANLLTSLAGTEATKRINLVLPYISVMLASIASRAPKQIAVPLGGLEADPEQAEQAAEHASAVTNFYWHRAQATADLRDATQDALVIGNGFLKVGWAHHAAEVEREDTDVALQLQQLMDFDLAEAKLAGREPAPLEEISKLVEVTQTVIERDEPFVEYVSPYDVFLPINARRMWETRWVAQRIVLPLDEVKANENFDAKARRDVQTTSASDRRHDEHIVNAWGADSETLQGDVNPFDTATIYEFYDLRARKLTVSQLGAERPLFEGDLPYSHRYPPFVHLPNYRESGDEFWAFGELENTAVIQSMFNEVLGEQYANVRRSGNKYFIDETIVDDDVAAGLESDEPDVYIPVKMPNGMLLKDAVVPVTRLPLPAEVYAHEQQLRDGMREVLGLNEFQAGTGAGPDRMSATAAAMMDGLATLRVQDKVKAVEDAASQVGLLILLLCQEFLDQPQAIRIAGEEGAQWMLADKDMIRGEFQLKVEGGSTQSINPGTKRQKGLELIQQVVPILAQMQLDPMPALRQAVRELGYDPDQIIQQPAAPPGQPGQDPAGGAGQDPMAAMMAQMGGGGAPPGDPMAAGAPQDMPADMFGGAPLPDATSGGLSL